MTTTWSEMRAKAVEQGLITLPADPQPAVLIDPAEIERQLIEDLTPVPARYPAAAYRDMARHYETLRDQYAEQRDALDPSARTYQRELHYLNHVVQSQQAAADKHHRLAEQAEKNR